MNTQLDSVQHQKLLIFYIVCKGLIQTYDLEQVGETYLKLWLINCIVYSVIIAWIKVNNIKGMECTRKVTRDSKNSYNKIPACVRVVEEEIKSRSGLSKCCSELDRLTTKRRMTRRTKRNRAEMEVGGVNTPLPCLLYTKTEKAIKLLSKEEEAEVTE